MDTNKFIQECITNLEELINRQLFEQDMLLNNLKVIENEIINLKMKKQVYEEYLQNKKGAYNAN